MTRSHVSSNAQPYTLDFSPGAFAVPASIFLNFNLPNATTWFYLSALLAITLFYQFHRLLSLLNWDLVALFMLVPGLLILQEFPATNPMSDHAGSATFGFWWAHGTVSPGACSIWP